MIGRPACCRPNAIFDALTHEIYRQGARPRLLGGADDAGKVFVDFPGGVCPRIEWRGLPDQITPLVDTLKVASATASKIMRGGLSTASLDFVSAEPPLVAVNGNGTAPKPVSPVTTDPTTLAALLLRQSELAADVTPEGEAEYQKVVAQIAALQ
jgi:hypothetical protein